MQKDIMKKSAPKKRTNKRHQFSLSDHKALIESHMVMLVLCNIAEKDGLFTDLINDTSVLAKVYVDELIDGLVARVGVKKAEGFLAELSSRLGLSIDVSVTDDDEDAAYAEE